MYMKVIYRLAAVFLAVDYKPPAFVAASLPGGKFLGFMKQFSQYDGIGFHNVGNVPPGNHQKMKGGLGVKVMKSQYFIVLIEFIAGDFPCGDFTKDTICHSLSYNILSKQKTLFKNKDG
jgi:hypothetical protein